MKPTRREFTFGLLAMLLPWKWGRKKHPNYVGSFTLTREDYEVVYPSLRIERELREAGFIEWKVDGDTFIGTFAYENRKACFEAIERHHFARVCGNICDPPNGLARVLALMPIYARESHKNIHSYFKVRD